MANLSESSGGCGRAALAAVVALLGSTAVAQANMAVPGDLVLMGLQGSGPEAMLWLLCAMLMCIGIEGAIYAYVRFIRWPFGISALANTASLVAGFFLTFGYAPLAGAVEGSGIAEVAIWLVLPTLVSTGIEGLVVVPLVKPEVTHRWLRGWSAVIVANLVTNAILAVTLLIAAGQAV